MTIVDSSTWADFFNGVESPHAQRLDQALQEEEDLGVIPIILTEVLRGFRTDAGFQRALGVLTALPVVFTRFPISGPTPLPVPTCVPMLACWPR